MPISGNLKDFPLPEVLLLIGTRTGRLRLYDVPEFGIMELDISMGNAHALQLGNTFLTEDREIVALLSVIIGTGEGMFEFRPQPVSIEQREQPLPLSKLVMLLVLHVDEAMARQRNHLSAESLYALQTPIPEIWIDPNLNLFFHQCKPLLVDGARSEEIAQFLGMEKDEVRLNLTYLRQLGFVKLLDAVEPMREARIEREISDKSNNYQLAAEASDLIRRTGKLLKLPFRAGR